LKGPLSMYWIDRIWPVNGKRYGAHWNRLSFSTWIR